MKGQLLSWRNGEKSQNLTFSTTRRSIKQRLFTTLQYEGVSKSFRTGRLERELQMGQLSATRCSYIAILWDNLVSFAAITLCVASQGVFVVAFVYFVMDSVRKLLDTASYTSTWPLSTLTYYHGIALLSQVHLVRESRTQDTRGVRQP
jgi:hypothetical protein